MTEQEKKDFEWASGYYLYDDLNDDWFNWDEKKKVEELKKNIELVREDGQLEIMRRDQRISELVKIDKEHQEINGKLRVEINRYKECYDI